MKRFARYLLIVLGCNILFLFAPKNECNDITVNCPSSLIRINNAMSFHMSWDGYNFITYAQNPGSLLRQGDLRQSRPLFVVAGSLAGYALWYASSPFHATILRAVSATPSGQFSDPDQRSLSIAVFLATFVLFNVILLLASCWLFETNLRFFSGKIRLPRWVMNLLLVLLCGCQLTKIFFWTPHQQMFALFTPLLCVYCCLRVMHNASKKFVYLASIGSGFLLLFYGNSLLLLPCLLGAIFASPCNRSGIEPDRAEAEPQTLSKSNVKPVVSQVALLCKIVSIVLLFFLPTIIWTLYLKSIGVDFTSAEISTYRQFIWMADAMAVSPAQFFDTLMTNTGHFISSIGNLVFIMVLFLSTLFIRRWNRPGSAQQPAMKPIWMILLLVTVFYWLLGYYSDRLTYTLAPLLLFSSAIILNHPSTTILQHRLAAVIIILSYVWIFFFDAPHFSPEYYL